MTTKHSPLSALKAQADKIAEMLKRAARGEKIDVQFAEKIKAARYKETFKFGIVMDDKVITIEMPWATIHNTSEPSLAEYILKQMRETRTPMTVNVLDRPRSRSTKALDVQQSAGAGRRQHN